MVEDTTSPEEWRSVVGYEGWYSVSSLGRVRRDRAGKGTHVGRIQLPYTDREGYQFICMSRHGKNDRRSVHTLVAEAFLGTTPIGCEVDHCDGNPAHNQQDNLEHVTHVENLRRAVDRRIRLTGLPSPNTTLTAEDVHAIRVSTDSQYVLAVRYGLKQGAISNIRSGKRWKHLPMPSAPQQIRQPY